MTKNAFGVAVAVMSLFHVSAHAASVSGTLSITVSPAPAPLAITMSPSSATEACNVAAGMVVSAISVTGGDGKPNTLSMTGDTTDFSLSSATPPANMVVASGGIAPADCAKSFTNTITATQP